MILTNLSEKYRDAKPLMILLDGGVVLGEEVDDNNRLHYVIKRGDDLTIEYAGNKKPKEILKETSITLLITHDKKTNSVKVEKL